MKVNSDLEKRISDTIDEIEIFLCDTDDDDDKERLEVISTWGIRKILKLLREVQREIASSEEET